MRYNTYMKRENVNLTVLPKSDNPSFTERENLLAHTPYRAERAFFSYVRGGMTNNVIAALKDFTGAGLVVGRLSDNPLTQCKYWAVCCVTLGTRYAIEGGLDEMTAFNLSDKYIMHIDALDSADAILDYLTTAVIELTETVRTASRAGLPAQLKDCLKYIDVHLHENVRAEDIAKEIGFNADYLSKYFKKHMGKSITDYVTEKRLEEARALIANGAELSYVAYSLGFCSQSYFTAKFKKQFGVTPYRYKTEIL